MHSVESYWTEKPHIDDDRTLDHIPPLKREQFELNYLISNAVSRLEPSSFNAPIYVSLVLNNPDPNSNQDLILIQQNKFYWISNRSGVAEHFFQNTVAFCRPPFIFNWTMGLFTWDPAVCHTFHQERAREACLPVLSSICLELVATYTRHQQRLHDDLQISAENALVSFSVWL